MASKAREYNRTILGQASWVKKSTNFSTGVVSITNYGPWNESGQRVYKRDYKYRSWNTQAGWKTFRASNGYLPTLAMTETQEQWIQPWTTVTYVQRTGTTEDRRTLTGNSVYVAPSSSLGFDDTTKRNRVTLAAQYEVLAKARDMKVNVAVALGEGRQTVRMLADTARTLGKAYRNFRRGRFKRAAQDLGIQKPTGTAANHWLAYAYGWRPLLSDCIGLAELAAQQLELGGRPPRMSVRSTQAGSAFEKSTHTYVANGQGPQCLNDGASTTSGITTYQGKAGLLLELKFEAAALAAQTGFGLTDPLLTAWELTPFSFVFDWFIDVGSWLEAMSSLQGWNVLTGFSGCENAFRGTCSQTRIWSGWTQEGYIPSFPVTYRKYTRTLWTGGVTNIKTPLWDGLNARRLTTTAALWRQRTRGDREFGKYRP